MQLYHPDTSHHLMFLCQWNVTDSHHHFSDYLSRQFILTTLLCFRTAYLLAGVKCFIKSMCCLCNNTFVIGQRIKLGITPDLAVMHVLLCRPHQIV